MWKDVNTDPPYDAAEDDRNGMEVDYTYAYVAYRYRNRPFLNGRIFVTLLPHLFSDNEWQGLGNDSPYEWDHVDVIAYLEAIDLRHVFEKEFNNGR